MLLAETGLEASRSRRVSQGCLSAFRISQSGFASPGDHSNSRHCWSISNGCRSFPGWFGPGGVEKAAEYLEMEPDEFVRKYVIIDGIININYSFRFICFNLRE